MRLEFSPEWKRRVFQDMYLSTGPMGTDKHLRLYRGILEHAIRDYAKLRDVAREDRASYSRDVLRDFLDARAWIFRKTPPHAWVDRVNSFVSVCLLLGVLPADVRRLAEEITQEELRLWSRKKTEVA